MAQGRLAGKVAIVTGAASRGPGVGTGKATAILFAWEGAKVLLVNRSESHARQLQTEIEREGGECSVCAADVTKAAEAEQMVAVAVQRYGKLDILVTMSGLQRRVPSWVTLTVRWVVRRGTMAVVSYKRSCN